MVKGWDGAMLSTASKINGRTSVDELIERLQMQ